MSCQFSVIAVAALPAWHTSLTAHGASVLLVCSPELEHWTAEQKEDVVVVVQSLRSKIKQYDDKTAQPLLVTTPPDELTRIDRIVRDIAAYVLILRAEELLHVKPAASPMLTNLLARADSTATSWHEKLCELNTRLVAAQPKPAPAAPAAVAPAPAAPAVGAGGPALIQPAPAIAAHEADQQPPHRNLSSSEALRVCLHALQQDAAAVHALPSVYFTQAGYAFRSHQLKIMTGLMMQEGYIKGWLPAFDAMQLLLLHHSPPPQNDGAAAAPGPAVKQLQCVAELKLGINSTEELLTRDGMQSLFNTTDGERVLRLLLQSCCGPLDKAHGKQAKGVSGMVSLLIAQSLMPNEWPQVRVS